MKGEKTYQSRYILKGIIPAVILTGMLFVALIISMRMGSVEFTNREFFGGLLKKEGFETESTILYAIRIPRTLAALMAGIGLSVSGVLLQAITGNYLAGPNIVGVNAGAGFAVMLCLFFLPGKIYAVSPAAFIGALVTTAAIIAISQKLGALPSTIILSGVACSTIFQAGISFFSIIDADVLVSYNAFSIGGFSGVTFEELVIPSIFIFVSLIVSLILSGKISALCLGDDMAAAIGINVKALRILCVIFASAAAAAVVSYAGLLGFVGLMVPNITRKLTGESITRQLIFAPLIGGILLTAADLLSRILFAPTEIPVGIITAMAGAPFFLILLLKRREGTYA